MIFWMSLFITEIIILFFWRVSLEFWTLRFLMNLNSKLHSFLHDGAGSDRSIIGHQERIFMGWLFLIFKLLSSKWILLLICHIHENIHVIIFIMQCNWFHHLYFIFIKIILFLFYILTLYQLFCLLRYP